MILPIVAYGDPVLKKHAGAITNEYPELKALIANMFETMYEASGVGLAAPQIGRDIRLFITDGAPFAEEDDVPTAPVAKPAAGNQNAQDILAMIRARQKA